jgi:hypothetical protein
MVSERLEDSEGMLISLDKYLFETIFSLTGRHKVFHTEAELTIEDERLESSRATSNSGS